MLGFPMGMAPELSRCLEGVWKKFQIINFDMANNVSSMKYALKSVSGLTDVGVPHGYGDMGMGWPQNTTQMCGGGLEKVSNG